MARQVVVSKQLTASAVAVIAASQALAAAGNLALVGGGTVTLDTQRRVSILSAADDSGLTWTVSGTNDQGAAISELLAGANAVAIATLQDFKTVTGVAGSGATAGNVQVGTNATGSSPWFVLNPHITPFSVDAEIEILSGAATVTLEVAHDSPLMPIPIYQQGYSQTLPIPPAFAWAGLTNVAGAAAGNVNTPVQAARLTVTLGTGKAQLALTQAGIRN